MEKNITTILAKFRVSFVTNFGANNEKISAMPVTNDCPENKTFSIYTPSGLLEMHITNPDAMGFFKPGKSYLLNITEVE